jgi:hydrogenase maturation factor
MQNKIIGAKRLTGFDMPTVWSVMTPLAIKTKSVNLVCLYLSIGARIPIVVTS